MLQGMSPAIWMLESDSSDDVSMNSLEITMTYCKLVRMVQHS